MIRFEDVTVTYEADRPGGVPEPALAGATFTVPEGELVLLAGPSGAGKSTLLGAVNGLVPHFTGGLLQGRVTVDGRDTREHAPRELCDVVGTVGQDPLSHFVTDTVEDELAYRMESLGLAPQVMRRRVEETLDLLALAPLRERPLGALSGGQQQRVAIGSVLTTHPKVLVLDEPTSALDPAAAEEVLAVLQRLVHDLGTTVLMAEHRLERVVQYADQVLLLPGRGEPPVLGDPATLMAVSPVHPPVVALGRLTGWSPLPLTVRAARRAAGPLREQLAQADPPARTGTGTGPGPATTVGGPGPAVKGRPARHRLGLLDRSRSGLLDRPGSRTGRVPADVPPAEIRALGLRRGRVPALRRVDLTVARGETVALMGRNGSGKSTLLSAMVGLLPPSAGEVRVHGVVPHRTPPRELLRHVGLVPQDPRDLLYADTVAAECAAADRDAGADPGTCRGLVDRLLGQIGDGTHPRDLSEGQRLALALAIVLTARPPLLLLDEPTRGLDQIAKSRLITILRELAAEGHAVLLATHDVELAAEIAHRVVLLAEGEVIADGPTASVVVSSPAFAPQIAKVLAPQEWLTVSEVEQGLRRTAGPADRTATDPPAPGPPPSHSPSPAPAPTPASDPAASASASAAAGPASRRLGEEGPSK